MPNRQMCGVRVWFALCSLVLLASAQQHRRAVVKCNDVKMVIPIKDTRATVQSLVDEVNKRVAKHRKLKDKNERVVELTVAGAALDDGDSLADVVQDMDILVAIMESSEGGIEEQCDADSGPGCGKASQLCDFDIVKAADMDKARFHKEYHGKKPVLITFENGANDWTDPGLWEFASLAKRHGNKVALSGYSEILVTLGGVGYDKIKIKDFIKNHVDNAEEGEVKYLCDPSLFSKLKDISGPLKLPAYVNKNPATSGDLFTLGKGGSSIGFYMCADTWTATVIGEKEWYVYPPVHRHVRTVPGGMPASYDQITWKETVLPTLSKEDQPMQCTQKAGDILYIPELWFRAEVNSKDTAAVMFQGKTHMIRDRDNNFSGGDLISSILGDKTRNDAENIKTVDSLLEGWAKAMDSKNSQYHSMSGQRYTYFGSANKLFQKEWPEKAKDHFTKALELNPFDANTYNSLGYALRALAEYPAARKAFEAGYKLAPRNLGTIAGLADFLASGSPTDKLVGKSIQEKVLVETRYKSGVGRNIADSILAGKFDS